MIRAIVLALALPLLVAAQPARIIFDTDMGNDIDDALALAMLHALQSQGEAKLLAVTTTKDNPWAGVYVDLVNHFYGRGSIPIGTVRGGKTPKDSPMIRVPAERKSSDGTFVYPRHLKTGAEAPEATAVLRQVLSQQPDGSVTIVQVGFSTNLARLLDTGPDSYSPLDGRKLVARKVRLLELMGGNFAGNKPEYNIATDIHSAQKLFSSWPTPIIASGFEIGESILYPASSIESDFAYVPHHPVADAYRAYKNMPYDRPTWDLTSALHAVRPNGGYFGLSPFGSISVAEDGTTTFHPGAGKHRYLTVTAEQKRKALEAMIELASRRP